MNLARAGDGGNRRVGRHSTDDVTRTSGPGPPSFGSCSRWPVLRPHAQLFFSCPLSKKHPAAVAFVTFPLSIFDIEVELILFAAAADKISSFGRLLLQTIELILIAFIPPRMMNVDQVRIH